LDPVPHAVFLTADPDAGSQLADLGAAGIITKPFDPSTFAAQVAAFLGRPAPTPPKSNVEAIAKSFRASLPPTIADITALWSDIRANGWQHDKAEGILERVHRLSGSAAMFGMPALGQAADRAEGILRAVRERVPDDGERSALDVAITRLQK